jgi:hypothetical protein
VTDTVWLKIMSNGELGEARVRALLIERFHVLTRSVDIDGADFLIQLSSSGRFSDELAPRLGIIQARFAQDETTSHLVPVDYVIDAGHTISEFFVLVTIGREDNVTNYLLSAADLANVRRTRREGKEFYSLTARERKPFVQKRISNMLDKIERALQQRTAEQNKKFYQTVTIPDFAFKRSSLDSKWLLPIPNEEGHIPDIIYSIRQSMRAQLYAFDDIVAAISTLLTSKTADECVKSIETVIDDRAFVREGTEEYFHFGPFHLTEQSVKLAKATNIHETRLNKLIAANQLERFLSVQQLIFDELRQFFERNRNPKMVQIDTRSMKVSNEHARATVNLSPATLDAIDVSIDLVAAGSYDAVQGRDKIIRSLPLWKYVLDYGPDATWRQLHRLQHLLLADFYGLVFPQEKGITPILPLFMAE